MKNNIIVMPLVSSLVFALSGCKGGQDNTEVGAFPKSVTENAASAQIMGETLEPYAVDMRMLVNKAIKDLASRLDVPSNEIKVIRIENVTWRTGSLGCPQKGMSYTQALVPGTLIVLRAHDDDYDFHSGSDGAPFYCANPKLPASASTAE